MAIPENLKDDVRNKYIIENKKPKEIACEFNLNVAEVRNFINKSGLSKTKKKQNAEMCRKVLKKSEIEREKQIEKTSLADSIEMHRTIQSLAMLQDEKGNYKQLATAEKCQENIDRLLGLYEKDNQQKAGTGVNITVASQDEADLIKEIQNVKAD